jgi:protein-tyrosine-phosphatase
MVNNSGAIAESPKQAQESRLWHADRIIHMDERRIRRETERVVQKVRKLVNPDASTSKQTFEAVLDKIIEHVHRNTGIEVANITQKTAAVLRDLPHEYGQLHEEIRSWDALITYLYIKYLREIGHLK